MKMPNDSQKTLHSSARAIEAIKRSAERTDEDLPGHGRADTELLEVVVAADRPMSARNGPAG